MAASLSVAVVLLLVVQVALYVWMAPRAFEFTDESYYLLNLLYWREFQGSVTFFGAYFDLPFRMLGQSITAVRLFSLGLLLACSAYCSRAVLRFTCNSESPLSTLTTTAFVAAGMAGAMLYFSLLSTLRVPSYNLGALCAALVATGLLLGMLSSGGTVRPRIWPMLAYGLALGACGVNKPTAGLAVGLLHALFLLIVGRQWLAANGLRFVVLALAGVALNVTVLSIIAPHWVSQLKEGLALVSSTDGRGLLTLANHARWDVQRIVSQHLHWAIVVAVMYLAGVWAEGRIRVQLMGVPELALVAAAAAALAVTDNKSVWLSIVSWAILMLTLAAAWHRKRSRAESGHFSTSVALPLMLMGLALGVSYGTNMPIVAHAKTNAVFAVLALLAALLHVSQAGSLPRPVLLTAFALLCLPGVAFQWRAAVHADHAYRQLQPMVLQTVPVKVGRSAAGLLVDAETARSLQVVEDALRAAGWQAGAPMLDFTGDGPGWVFAMGGRPVGVPWLLGGYPGSEETARRVLRSQQRELLRRSWLLVSEANPRRIGSWSSLLSERLGDTAHERVASVTVAAPYGWKKNAPQYVDVQLWRPLSR